MQKNACGGGPGWIIQHFGCFVKIMDLGLFIFFPFLAGTEAMSVEGAEEIL